MLDELEMSEEKGNRTAMEFFFPLEVKTYLHLKKQQLNTDGRVSGPKVTLRLEDRVSRKSFFNTFLLIFCQGDVNLSSRDRECIKGTIHLVANYKNALTHVLGQSAISVSEKSAFASQLV